MATIKDFFVKQGAQATTTLVAGAGLTNQLTLAGGASGAPGVTSITASGTDANINVNIVPKGAGIFTVAGVQIGVPGGTSGQIQYNNAGAFGGISTTGTGNVVLATSAAVTTPTITGGTHVAITSLGVRNAGVGAFDLTLAYSGTLTAGRALTFNVNDVARAINMGGDLVLAGALTTSGAFGLTLALTGATSVTLPTAGTLATLAGIETLTNKTLTTPALSGSTYSTAPTITAGTNAQGQAALTADLSIITTTAASPSGVTLPTATIGRIVTVVNKGTNPINVYPATGATIDALAVNTAISVPVGGIVIFDASTTTQWYSSLNASIAGASVVGNISGAAGSLSPGNTINGTSFTGAAPITVTANTTNALTINNGGAGAAAGATFNGSTAVTVSYNTVGAPSVTGTNASGTWAISITGTAAVGTAVTTTNDVASATTFFPTFVTANTGNNPITVSSTKLTYVPSTGVLSSTSFTGAGTGLTGTASALSIGGNAATATTATTASATTAAATFNNSGTGAASGATFNGGTAQTISNNTIGAVALAGSTMTGFLTLSADPSSPLHAATKQYVDAVKTGLDLKDSVRSSSTAAFTVIYANGSAGVGATLTNSGVQAAFVADSVTLNVNDRVLIKDQVSAFQNGIYNVTVAGTASTNWVLTRSTDADTSPEVTGGMFTFIEEGTINAFSGWVNTSTGVTTMGTTNLTFSQFSGAGTITAGNGLVRVGSTIYFQSSTGYTTGDLFYANSGTTVGKLTMAATNNVLLSGGVGVAPSWGLVSLTAAVSGTLPVANGGSGAATFTAGYLKASGTAAFTTVATIPGSDISGNISGNAANVTGIVATANGGTGANLTLSQFGVVIASTASAMTSTAAGTTKQVFAATTSAAPTFQTLDMTFMPDAMWKETARVATTAQQALSGGTAFPTIDGIATVAGDRVLLKSQTAAAENGIYVVSGTATAWTLTRPTDADVASKIANGIVGADVGTANGGKSYHTTFRTSDTLATTAMNWYEVLDFSIVGVSGYVPKTDGTGASGTWGISITGNAATATTATSATSATNATNVGITDDTATAATHYIGFVAATSGNNPVKVSSTKLTYNPSTGVLNATGGFSGTATNATNIGITDDVATATAVYPTWVGTPSGNQPARTSSSKFSFVPSTGTVTATTFSGALSGTATAASTITVADDTTTNATVYLVWAPAASGNVTAKVSSSKVSFNPSTGIVTAAGGLSTIGTVTTAIITYGANASVTTASAAVSTTGATSVDTWSSTTYRSARYSVQIVDGTSYEMADMLIIHDGTTAYVTTFGNVFTSTFSLGAFDATIATGVVTVTYTAIAATTKTVKFTRQLLTI
jgi:hypothetical protein